MSRKLKQAYFIVPHNLTIPEKNLFDSKESEFEFVFPQPPRVTVKEEYIVYDAVAFVSSIGGTMGLCIGFSFYNSISVIMGLVEMGIRKLQREDRKDKKHKTQTIVVENLIPLDEMVQGPSDINSKILKQMATMKESIKREIKSEIMKELGKEPKN